MHIVLGNAHLDPNHYQYFSILSKLYHSKVELGIQDWRIIFIIPPGRRPLAGYRNILSWIVVLWFEIPSLLLAPVKVATVVVSGEPPLWTQVHAGVVSEGAARVQLRREVRERWEEDTRVDQVYLVGLVAEAVIHTEGMLARARPFMGEDHTSSELELTCHELGTNDVNCIAFWWCSSCWKPFIGFVFL